MMIMIGYMWFRACSMLTSTNFSSFWSRDNVDSLRAGQTVSQLHLSLRKAMPT